MNNGCLVADGATDTLAHDLSAEHRIIARIDGPESEILQAIRGMALACRSCCSFCCRFRITSPCCLSAAHCSPAPSSSSAVGLLEERLRSLEDSEDIIDGLLQGAAEFYGAARASVVEADWDLKIGLLTYEWCAEGVEHQKNMLQYISEEQIESAQQLWERT